MMSSNNSWPPLQWTHVWGDSLLSILISKHLYLYSPGSTSVKSIFPFTPGQVPLTLDPNLEVSRCLALTLRQEEHQAMGSSTFALKSDFKVHSLKQVLNLSFCKVGALVYLPDSLASKV